MVVVGLCQKKNKSHNVVTEFEQDEKTHNSIHSGVKMCLIVTINNPQNHTGAVNGLVMSYKLGDISTKITLAHAIINYFSIFSL